MKAATPPDTVLEAVRIEVGSLEHIVPEAMQLAWEALKADTPYAGAVLSIDVVPVHVRCRGCGHEHVPEDVAIMLCPVCEVARPEVLQGSGVLLRSLEVATS